MGEESNGRFNDQENMKRIKENDEIKNVLLHQLCSEMLTMKKEVEDLQAEVKLNQLRHEDEIGDAYANIASMKRHINAIQEVERITEIKINGGKDQL